MTEPTDRSGAEGFSFSDKRRIDPQTYAVRESPTPSPAGPGEPTAVEDILEAEVIEESLDLDVRDAQIAELTADVQRLQAEFANYRKRVERDRDLVRQQAVASTVAELLPVLDDVERARQHGDLEGAFKSVGEAFEGTVTRIGMTKFGAVGEPFDPTVHEAIALETGTDLDGPTITAVHQPGYTFGGRVVRPAVVSVAEPA